MADDKLDIGFLLPSFEGGGAEPVMVTLANAFAERGYAVEMVVVRNTGPNQQNLSPRVMLTDLGKSRTLNAPVALLRHLWRSQPSIFVSAFTHLNVITAAITPFVKSKTVLTEHTMLSRSRIDTVGSKMRALVRVFYRFSDHLVGVSRGAAQDAQRVADLPNEKVSWIGNPVATAEALATLPQQDDAWLSSRRGPVIATAGRLEPIKDHETLLRAFAQLREAKDASLMILGEGSQRQRLQDLAASLGISEHVHLPGFVSNPLSYLVKADLFALTSIYEAFGNVLVEAMLAGLPIVSTDCPAGPREVLDGGRYGQLVPVGDVEALTGAFIAALDTVTDTDFLHARAQDFSTDRITDRYEGLFKALLDSRDQARPRHTSISS